MDQLTRTARTTGLLYLGLAVTGLLGFLVIRSQLFVPDDPGATLANLGEHESLARLGIALELGVVVTQALVAVWFYRLFRRVDSVAAGSIAAFGLVNAASILVSAAFLATALDVSLDAGLAPGGSAEATAQLMYVVSGHLWAAGGVFFGLWLVPMGLCVLRTGSMPRPLGWLLVGGGAGYVLSSFASYLVPDVDALAAVLVVPASVGEFWMIGYLLLRGMGRRSGDPVRPAVAAMGG
jgi:hypothetical protein